MGLSPGQHVGPYEVTGRLGAGGMGEVYRARDVRLQRNVALKILPEAVARDADRLMRFTREAQTLAALNHSNIAAIYGIEDSGPLHAIAMELVDGEDLSQRIGRGALPLDDALPIARQLAEALETAHDAGIVHRDLKPANIMVRSDGTVKVLDFGLAKVAPPAATSAASDEMNSPTFTSPAMTAAGVLLGTAPYIAPEIAKGKPADKRADVWAFGVVFFEMLSGRRLFAGDSAMETLAAVLRAKVDWSALPPSTPPPIRQLIERCLEPDPKLRLRDIGEARILLSAPQATTASRAAERPEPWRGRRSTRVAVAIAVAAGVLLAVAAGASRLTRTAAVPPKMVEISTELPGPFALAPDGSAFAYMSGGHLYLQTFGSVEPQDLGEAAPAGNQIVLWSPDGKWVVYSAEGLLRRVPASGGSPFVICSIPATGALMSAAWLNDGTIVFAVWREHLYRVPATGGTPARLLEINPATEVDFHFVALLPDDRLLIAPHRRAEGTTAFEILDGSKRTVLTEDGSVLEMRPTRDGRMLVLRSGANPGLWIAPFASGTLDLSKATLVQADAAAFSLASDDTLLMRVSAPVMSSLGWTDSSGRVSPVPGGPTVVRRNGLAVSPDGRQAAFVVSARGAVNMVVRDLQTGADTALTFNRATDVKGTWMLHDPQWHPAGNRLLYAMGGVEAAARIFEQRLDIAGPPRALVAGISASISHDGRTLYVIDDVRGEGRLSRRTINTDGSIGPAEMMLPDTDVDDLVPSPDGRIAAVVFHADRDRREIDLLALDGGARQRVTTDRGVHPHFSSDGRTLYFLGNERAANGRRTLRVMRAPVTATPLQVGKPEPVFGEATTADRLEITQFDVTRDGRLLVAIEDSTSRRSRSVLVQNWPALVSGR
jgi:eukaryotic-like serine/threonine-protein kinase